LCRRCRRRGSLTDHRTGMLDAARRRLPATKQRQNVHRITSWRMEPFA
jgi:hypothetical protein